VGLAFELVSERLEHGPLTGAVLDCPGEKPIREPRVSG
jgi:hypothetical protein